MALSEDQYKQISDYFSGGMGPEEEKLFLNQVAANEEWHTEFEWQKTLKGKQDVYQQLPELFTSVDKESEQYKKDKERIRKIQQLAEDKEEEKQDETPVRNMRYRQWLIAASVLALVAVAGLVIYYFTKINKPPIAKNPKESPVDTIHNKQQPDREVPLERGDSYLAYEKFYSPYQPGDNIPVELQNAAANYKIKNYQVALDEVSDISDKRGNDPGEQKVINTWAAFYKGLCLLELKKDNEAYIELSKVNNNRDVLKEVKDDVLWYFAMACLKNNKKNEAVAALSNIPPVNSKYGKKADAVLKSLDKK